MAATQDLLTARPENIGSYVEGSDAPEMAQEFRVPVLSGLTRAVASLGLFVLVPVWLLTAGAAVAAWRRARPVAVATLFVLAGLEPLRRPGCPLIGELGLTSTNVTTQWGNLDCQNGVDGADVVAGLAYTIELEIPVFQEPQGGPIEDPCPPLDTYLEWIPLD